MTKMFTLPGKPTGKGRPRFTKSGHAYTPAKTKDYEERLKSAYKHFNGDFIFPKNTALAMHIIACFEIPKSVSKSKRHEMLVNKTKPVVKPDVDNIIKIVADALNKVAYEDDKQLVLISCEKIYSKNPSIVVSICEIEE